MQETVRDAGSVPGFGRASGGGNGNPLQCSGLTMPWTEEPGGSQPMGLQRVGCDWSYWARLQTSLCCTVGFKGSEELSKRRQTRDRPWFPESSRRGRCWAWEVFIIPEGWRTAGQWSQSILLEAEMFSLLLAIATLLAVPTISTVKWLLLQFLIQLLFIYYSDMWGEVKSWLLNYQVYNICQIPFLCFLMCCTKMRAWRERERDVCLLRERLNVF